MSIVIPPLKSQGIKTKLVPWIMENIPKTNGRWIEPFLGTGVVAFNSGFKEAILNDINPHIISFYLSMQYGLIRPSVVRTYLEEEGEKLKRYGYDYYRIVRDKFNISSSSWNFLFLSRCGFNGMMRFNKKGEWNIPFCKKPERLSKAYITKIVNQVNAVSKVIQPNWIFLNKSFKEIIPMADEKDIIYCDPPYLGRYVDYYNGWSEKDEETLFELLSATKAKFVLSTWHHNEYRQNYSIDKYWNKFNIITRNHFYHVGGKIENRKGITEALVRNF